MTVDTRRPYGPSRKDQGVTACRRPDLDLVSFGEMFDSFNMVRSAAPNAPVLADGDHGYGKVLSYCCQPGLKMGYRPPLAPRQRIIGVSTPKAPTMRPKTEQPAPHQEGMPAIGRRIRAFRKLQRRRLLDLADAAGCSESLLSRIENGRVTPSLSTLHRLSRALRVNVAVLMEDRQERICTVYQPEDRPRTAHSNAAEGDGSMAESLIPYAEDRRLEALIVRLPAGGALCGPFRHDGEEAGLVLEGELELTVAGEIHKVRAGASFFFESDHVHCYRAGSAEGCRVVWVNTPPTF